MLFPQDRVRDLDHVTFWLKILSIDISNMPIYLLKNVKRFFHFFSTKYQCIRF